MNDVSPKAMNMAADVIAKIDAMAYEMRDDRNDGWIQLHYRNALYQITQHLDKVLKK